MLKQLPRIALKSARPQGLKFRTAESALKDFDPQLAAKKETPPEEAELSIMSEIGPEAWGGVDSKMVQKALKQIGNAPIRLILNSPGGDAFEGIAIYNLLRDHPQQVTVHVIGMAASAASVIAMAGDRIEMAEATKMMIHSAWGVVVGNSDDLAAMKEFLDQFDQDIAELYARRSGKKPEDVLAMMKKETWMTAKQAVSEGFADVAISEEPDSKKKKMPAYASIFTNSALPPAALLAASGERQRFAVRMSAAKQSTPGVSGTAVVKLFPKPPKGPEMKTREHIAALENKRAANMARMNEIMQASAESGSTLDAPQQQEYDGLKLEVDTIDKDLVRWRAHEQMQIAQAAAVPPAPAPDLGAPRPATNLPASPHVVTLGSQVEREIQGIAFVRYVRAMVMAKGSLPGALSLAQHNKKWREETPLVERVLMAAVAGGDTTTAGWASELAYAQNLGAEFINFLRPQTIIGKMTKLTRVPFNVRVAGQTSGSSGNWVGQGKPVPVSKLATTAVTLGIAKAAGLVVLDNELVRISDPSAELLVRNDLAAAIGQFTDQQFVDPAVQAVANVSPASITANVEPIAPAGGTAANFRSDLQKLVQTMLALNFDPRNLTLIMTPGQALAISLMLTANGVPLYPNLTMNGGELVGIPVVTSQSAQLAASPSAGEGGMIIAVMANDVMLADDGGVTIDVSSEASIEMLDNPTNTSTGGTTATQMVSMYQTNSVAIRAVRFINWAKRRASIVAFIKDANYSG